MPFLGGLDIEGTDNLWARREMENDTDFQALALDQYQE